MNPRYFVLAIAAVLLGSVLAIVLPPSSKTNAASSLVTSDCGEIQPKVLNIRYDLPGANVPARVTSTQAIQIATNHAFVRSQLPAPLVKTQYVLYSNDNRGVAPTIGDDDAADQHLVYQSVPAWIVTFCGVVTYPHTRPVAAGSGGVSIPQRNEWNVVINAQTGAFMEEFSIR